MRRLESFKEAGPGHCSTARTGMRLQALLPILTLALVLIGPQSAMAYFNGGYKNVSNKGALCTIETQNPYITSTGSSSAWAMVGVSGSAYKYAQVGWAKDPGFTAPKYFWEWSKSSTVWGQKYLGTASSGSHNDFKVDGGSSAFSFLINGVSYGSVSYSTLGWSANDVWFAGETWNSGDQCPGKTSNPVTMGASKYKSTGGTWYSAGVTGYKDHSSFRNNIDTGDTTWEIWDSRY